MVSIDKQQYKEVLRDSFYVYMITFSSANPQLAVFVHIVYR